TAGQKAGLVRGIAEVRPGTVLGREWNGRMQRVSVLADGFAWNGNTYRSLSQVAFAITGTRWNGPRFFGLRDKTAKGTSARSPEQRSMYAARFIPGCRPIRDWSRTSTRSMPSMTPVRPTFVARPMPAG